jgi:hypothetical protein
MGLVTGNKRRGEIVAARYPGKWESLTISTESAQGKHNAYRCAQRIARAAKSAGFPILVGSGHSGTAVSSDGTMWLCSLSVAWPSGETVDRIVTKDLLWDAELGRASVDQNTRDDYSDVSGWFKASFLGRFRGYRVWRCGF